MNRSAINDLLGSIVCTWYRSAAQWTPPGALSTQTCVSCRSAIVATVVDIGQWPHDLMHQLATAIDGAAAEIETSRNADAWYAASPDTHASTTVHVAEAITEHLDDILDVLTQCVAPRLDVWLAAEVSRSLRV